MQVAGFEAVSIVVSMNTSINQVLKKINGCQLVLLDHQMHMFSGAEVARLIPKDITLVTTSDHKAIDAYCTYRLLGKYEHPFPLKEVAHLIIQMVKVHKAQ